MKWAWRIGVIAGIPIYIHFTFLLLLVWVAVSHYSGENPWQRVAGGMLLVCLLFGIVVLHELGHALAARVFGIPTRDITLLPIGGVARLERMPEDPWQEFVVALAGPAVNVMLAIGLLWVIIATGEFSTIDSVTHFPGPLLDQLFWVNVVMVVFNMLPAFPMDGGRVLRALLALTMDYVRATQIAASVGQAMALLFGFAGLFGNPMLVFVALFVWLGADQEASMVRMKSSLSGIPLSRAMITQFQTLSPNEPISSAVTHLLAGFQQDFPVVEADRVVGLLSRGDVLSALSEGRVNEPVSSVMVRDFATAHPGEMLDSISTRMQGAPAFSVPVLRNGQLVGILTTENLGEFLMIQDAIRANSNR